MNVRLYAPPLPRGGWVLSLAILLAGFFFFREEDANETTSNEDTHEPRKDGEQQHNATASPAYQTDEEARSAPSEKHCDRERHNRATSPKTPANTSDTPFSTLLGKTWTGDGNVHEISELEGDDHYPAVFVAAATAAASAVRKSHLAYLDSANCWRVEREAFRIRVHEHIQRELRRRSIEAAGALASVVL